MNRKWRTTLVGLVLSGSLAGNAADQRVSAFRIEPIAAEPEPALTRVWTNREVTDRDASWTEGILFTNVTHRTFRFAPREGVRIQSVTALTPELAVYREGHTVTLTNAEIPSSSEWRYSYGTARFEVVYARDDTNGTSVVNVPLAYEFERIPVRLNSRYDPESLAHNLYTNVVGRIAGKTPAAAKPLLVFRDGWARWYGETVWSPAGWLNVPGKTSLSIGNYFNGNPVGYASWSQGAGTLLTRRHLVTAGHMCWPPFTNHWYRFLDTNNVAHDRRIVAALQCVDGATRKLWTDGGTIALRAGVKEAGVDIALALLDRDLPDSVLAAPCLDRSRLREYLPHYNPTNNHFAMPAAAPPLLYAQMDQGKNAKVESLAGASGLEAAWRTGPGPGGNSGSPSYFVIRDDLVLFTWAWSSPWVVTNLANLCYSNRIAPEKYRLRFYDLSGFKRYPLAEGR